MAQDLDQSPALPFDILTEGPTIGPVRNYNPATGGGTPGGSNGQVQYNNSGVFGGLTNTQLTADINVFGSTLSGAAPASGGGTTNFLRADGTWQVPPAGSIPDGNKGDITTSGGGTTWTINSSAVTYAKMQNVSIGPAFLGRSTSGAGTVQELTGTQGTALLDPFSTTTTTKGVVPGSNNVNLTTAFLRADGTWQVPPGGGTGAPPGGATNTVQYNAGGGIFGGMSGTSWDDTNRALTATGAIVTTSKPWNRTQTWNAGGVTFDYELDNVTDTASAAASTIIHRQVNGTDQWVVRKDGTLITGLIPAANGGTGQITYTIGDILYASAATTLSKLSDVATGNALISGGVGVAPSWGKIGLSTHVTGNLPVANLNSGTNASATTAWFGDGTWKIALTGPGTTVKGAPPIWSTTTGGVVVDGTGFINVRAYNVLPGNSAATNDTNLAAVHTAIVAAGGGTIYIPFGTYNLSATWAITGSNITILGDGNGTILNQTTLTVDAISNSGSNNRFTNFQIKYPSLATAGYGLNNTSAGTMVNNKYDFITITNACNGFHSHNENGAYYFTLRVASAANVGFFFDNTSNAVLNTFDFDQANLNYTSSGVGLFITGPCQGLQIMNGELFHWNRTCSIGGGSPGLANQPAYNNFANIYFNDGYQQDLITLAYDLQFTQCEWSNGVVPGGDNGLGIAGGDLIKFDNCDFVICGAHGCLVQPGVTNTAFIGCSFISNSQLGSFNGLTFGAGVTDFIVKGCIAKNDSNFGAAHNQVYGILVSSGASNRYIIEGNLITSNVTGGVFDGGTGISKQVANNF